MNKSKAISWNCLGCLGESPKEITLCKIVDCSLWSFRFGYSVKDKRYLERIKKAEKNYPKEYQEFIQVLSERALNANISSENTLMDRILKENLFAIRITLDKDKHFQKEKINHPEKKN